MEKTTAEKLKELFNTTKKKVIGVITAALIAAAGVIAEGTAVEFAQGFLTDTTEQVEK